MNFEKFTIKSQEALQKSAEIAMSLQHQAIEPGHILKAILETDENVPNYLFKKLNVNAVLLNRKLDEVVHGYPRVSGQQPYLSSASNTLLMQAEKKLREFKDEYIAVEHLVLALLASKDKVASVLRDAGV